MLLFQCRRYHGCATPHPEINELFYSNEQWHFNGLNQQTLCYEQIKILIANPLFRLFKASNEETNTLYLFFNDQLSNADWRLLHLVSDLN